jgi:hypothetical protein
MTPAKYAREKQKDIRQPRRSFETYKCRAAPADAANNASADLVAPGFLQKKGYQKSLPTSTA